MLSVSTNIVSRGGIPKRGISGGRLLTTCLVALFAALAAAAQNYEPIPPAQTPGTPVSTASLSGFVRAKASPDECFLALGENVQYDFIGPGCEQRGKIPKVNQGYVWGAVVVGREIWFGSTPNGQCITHGGVVSDPSTLTPYMTDSWACEFGSSPYVPTPLPAQIGDFRPPRIYVYNIDTKTIQDITPKGPTPPLYLDQLLMATRGVRAAMTVGDYVIFGGPALAADGRINWFAFNKNTKQFVAKFQQTGYANLRRFVNYNGVQYTAVQKSGGAGGAVLRVSFTPPATPPPTQTPGLPPPNVPVCATCFQFQKVGDTDGQGAYIAAHNGRLYVSTWPNPGLAGLWMSPPIPAGGLTAAHAGSWTKVWQASDYEPDPAIAAVYAGGALYSFGGYLYWGTMHVPWSWVGGITRVYGLPTTQEEAQALITNSFRGIAIFRGRNFETGNPDIELLYGEAQLPVFHPASGGNPSKWVRTPNNMPDGKKLPKFGPTGFGNPYNNYTWQMTVWNNKLWVGTMDWSYMAAKGAQLGQTMKLNGFTVTLPQLDGSRFGADLYSFASVSSPAVAESITGVGNYTNYGVRNILPVSSTMMFIGTANPMNLLTNKTDDVPEGGWELIELNAAPTLPPRRF